MDHALTNNGKDGLAAARPASKRAFYTRSLSWVNSFQGFYKVFGI